MREIRPFVVVRDGEPVAYADPQPSGYIDHFFVAAAHAKQGLGRLLMAHIHQTAMADAMPMLT
jgi:putative acetyltransferase